MSETATVKLRIPRQDLASFHHFPATANGASEWVKTLPIANTRQSVYQILAATQDLNRVALAPTERFRILETLRPNLLLALSSLARGYLNQPLVLPDEPRRQAALAEELCRTFATGYTLVAAHTIRKRSEVQDANPARLACEGLHRAVQFTGRRLLQAYQLYQSIEPLTWHALHQLYEIAERQHLSTLPVHNLSGQSETLKEAYLQALLLGCCKANQLRQTDLAAIRFGLQDWCKAAELLSSNDSRKGLFVVDLNGDYPPMYLSTRSEEGPHTRYIDTHKLVAQLKALRDEDLARGRRGIRLEQDITLPSNILDHLINSLGSQSLRNFSRASGNETELEVAVGLGAAHYHLAGCRTFDELFPQPQSTAEEKSGAVFSARDVHNDLWTQVEPDAVQHDQHKREVPSDIPNIQVDEKSLARLEGREREHHERSLIQRFPITHCTAINSSPGGYCLQWPEHASANLHSGDILCLREKGREQGLEDWVVAAVRWISALEKAQTLIGVELLSPGALPCALQIPDPQRNTLSEPIRVLLLPQIKLVGKPETLVTPRTGFRERQKVILLRDGEEFLVQLLRQIGATAGYSQFDFRYIRELDQRVDDYDGPEQGRPDFDSLWSHI